MGICIPALAHKVRELWSLDWAQRRSRTAQNNGLLVFVQRGHLLEGQTERAYLPEDNPKGVDVGGEAVLFSGAHFIRHVSRCPREAELVPCALDLFQFPCNPKIKDADLALAIETNVLWFQVAEEHTLGMKIFHTPGNPQSSRFDTWKHAFHVLCRTLKLAKSTALFLLPSFHDIIECFCKVFENNEVGAFGIRDGFSDVSSNSAVDLDNVRMVQSAQESRLQCEIDRTLPESLGATVHGWIDALERIFCFWTAVQRNLMDGTKCALSQKFGHGDSVPVQLENLQHGRSVKLSVLLEEIHSLLDRDGNIRWFFLLLLCNRHCENGLG
mmetsp:Transcript_6801/g.15551  ORF Transcript_6801/g.15551 Transcript_6801/m.15551 type:complete len:327 (-) Transcript_6801:28-1008(-)